MAERRVAGVPLPVDATRSVDLRGEPAENRPSRLHAPAVGAPRLVRRRPSGSAAPAAAADGAADPPAGSPRHERGGRRLSLRRQLRRRTRRRRPPAQRGPVAPRLGDGGSALRGLRGRRPQVGRATGCGADCRTDGEPNDPEASANLPWASWGSRPAASRPGLLSAGAPVSPESSESVARAARGASDPPIGAPCVSRVVTKPTRTRHIFCARLDRRGRRVAPHPGWGCRPRCVLRLGAGYSS